MLKTISAALLAISVLAAPAMAADAAQTTTTPAPITKTTPAPAIKPVQAKPGVMNANARMGRHHHGFRRYHRHHRFHKRFRHFHKHIGALKAHPFAKLSVRHVTHAVTRG